MNTHQTRRPEIRSTIRAIRPRLAIVGAGIGGLSAALALARAGSDVTVFEQTASVAAFGAGVQLSPNATAVLARLGLLDAVRRRAVAPHEVLIRRGRDGIALAHIPLADGRFATPFLVVLRADLQDVLADAARRESAIGLRFGERITAFTDDADGVRVLAAQPSSSGEVFDGLVGADGIRSGVRRRLAGRAPDDAVSAGRSAWRSLIASDAAPAEARHPRSNLWLGDKAHLVHYPVDGGRTINVVAIVDDDMTAPDEAAFWSTPADRSLLEARFSGWADPVRRLIGAASDWRKWPLFDRPPLAAWSRGAVTLLGDAAHPMLPFLAQGAAQSIEDAAVLADCVVAHSPDLPRAFSVYEQLRKGRTARVQLESRKMARVYHLARPASLARDAVLRSLGPRRLAARYDWLYAGPTSTDDFNQFAYTRGSKQH